MGDVAQLPYTEDVTITLTIKPEIEAGLLSRAKAQGVSLQEYLQGLVEESIDQPEASDREQAVRRMLEFGDKYQLGLGEPITRAMLHEGHRH